MMNGLFCGLRLVVSSLIIDPSRLLYNLQREVESMDSLVAVEGKSLGVWT